MIPSANCVKLCEDSEGLKLSPYLDVNDVATIGIGSTYYENGTKVTMTDSPISSDRAYALMTTVLIRFGFQVDKLVTVKLTQNQFDALVDFAYNLGVQTLKNSTLLKKLNLGDYSGASDEFEKWNHARGKVCQGLTIRRQKEKELFLS